MISSSTLPLLVSSSFSNSVSDNKPDESDNDVLQTNILQSFRRKFPQGDLTTLKKQDSKLIKAFNDSLSEEKYPYVQTQVISTPNSISEFSHHYARVLLRRAHLSTFSEKSQV